MTDYAYPVGSTVGVTELGSHEGELELPEGSRGVVLEIIENDMGYDQAEVDFGQYGVHVTYDDQVALVEEPATAQIQVGDKVRLTGSLWPNYGLQPGDIVTVTEISHEGVIFGDRGAGSLGSTPHGFYDGGYSCELVETALLSAPAAVERLAENLSVALNDWDAFSTTVSQFDQDTVDPNHYKFPGGAEVRHISEWLTANAAQALQYIARSSRIDGQNKGDASEDIRKAIRFLEFELERLDV